MFSWLRRLAPVMVGLSTATCFRPPADGRDHGSWTYEVDAPESGSRVVHVRATFEGARTERLTIGPSLRPFIHNVRLVDARRSVERLEGDWFERSCNHRCTIAYDVDLGEVANGCGEEVDCARRVGGATLSPSLAWLVHPTPRRDVPVTVHVRTSRPEEFATGMSALDTSGMSFAFRSYDLDEGSFTAFGPMRRFRIDVPGEGRRARLDVAVLGDKPYAMDDASMRTWIEEAARITVPLFGRFPVDRATLFVVPADGEEEVVFGKVLSLAGASVVLVVGDRMPSAARHRDWVLVHELFHLGFPTFRGEGRWLGEGLATYYEPLLRARAGWTSDTEVFRQFARNLPRGQPSSSPLGLAARDDADSIYWGGALFCLAADVRIREETRGRRSLDDVVRAALARGGNATRVWSLRDVLQLGDATTGTRVLSDMYERHVLSNERIDVEALLAALGAGAEGTDDTKPLAWVRRRLIDAPDPTRLARREP
jgi:hypothetical protein